ncbi:MULTISPECIES: alpha/beta hydrolase [unclassified Streptomyces]|uniref:alpha/beta hydrolase n=1 Tax=unclassified Streptomyces TaxID=2593676 RepID=UPI0022B6E38E|nr:MULTISPECIES: alpha/beta hydrolase [unclassified Streptomyces]MCZ7414933.1 alpha/beta hydrolase [Streptomyces sp. WMMC897]MCZ7431876.1 alpha/beta hydrolase [Streptomyces sp. WMMC1477]
MESGLTWGELQDLDLSGIRDAADGWAEARDRAGNARDDVDKKMVASLRDSQEGESEKAAVGRLKRLGENFHYVYVECGLLNTALDGLATELTPHQRAVREAAEDALALKFTVHADGSVTYPPAPLVPGGEENPGGTVTGANGWADGLHDWGLTALDFNPNRPKAQDIADRISDAVRKARAIDSAYAEAIARMKTKPGVDVSDAMWTDAYRDSEAMGTAADDYLPEGLGQCTSPEQRKVWWDGLSEDQRQQYLTLHPDVIGNLDGIPAAVRDEANRSYLPLLMGKLEATDTDEARNQLKALEVIDTKLRGENEIPMFLLGIDDEGNGRAIVSYGNPDTSRNVSAYVPGLGTSLDEAFAKNDLLRAQQTAEGARELDPSSASIVWLGYDAPQLPAEDLLDNADVMSNDHAAAGAPAYNSFMNGLAATNDHADPHITAIGHSYGSLTVGLAAQEPGGIPGADDIILLGSPGVNAEKASELGVGSDHVYVGAAENDPVTQLPSKGEIAGGGGGLVFGPLGSYVGYELGDIGDDDIWFGKDPASEAFGANRFEVDDGPRPFVDGEGATPAHSNYFNPEKDHKSADNIAAVVAGQPELVVPEEHR